MIRKSGQILLLLTLIALTSCGENKNEKVYFDRTKGESRAEFYGELINSTIEKNLAKPLADSTEEAYISAFWGMELANYRSDAAYSAVKEALGQFDKRSPSFQRAMLEVVYTIYYNDFENEVENILAGVENPKLFAMGVNYLARLKGRDSYSGYLKLMKTKFPEWQNDPILYMLNYQLNNPDVSPPPVKELIAHNFGKPVIFTFQRKNRDYPGITMIKKAEGKFLRTTSDSLFYIPQLARAVTDLPGYITNGNTPQGVLSLQGIDTSDNVFIGPTPNLQLKLPYEANVKEFFHGGVKDSDWSAGLYASVLPESWRGYIPVYEAYYAGKAGRTEIISHGTTIDPDYYKNSPFYPNTPSLGCLTASEIWSPEDGSRIHSDQVKLIDAYYSLDNKEGYFIVVELNDINRPVTYGEISGLIEELNL